MLFAAPRQPIKPHRRYAVETGLRPTQFNPLENL